MTKKKLDWRQKEIEDSVESFAVTKAVAVVLARVAQAPGSLFPGHIKRALPASVVARCLEAGFLERQGGATVNGERQPGRVTLTEAGSLALQLARFSKKRRPIETALRHIRVDSQKARQ